MGLNNVNLILEFRNEVKMGLKYVSLILGLGVLTLALNQMWRRSQLSRIGSFLMLSKRCLTKDLLRGSYVEMRGWICPTLILEGWYVCLFCRRLSYQLLLPCQPQALEHRSWYHLLPELSLGNYMKSFWWSWNCTADAWAQSGRQGDGLGRGETQVDIHDRMCSHHSYFCHWAYPCI